MSRRFFRNRHLLSVITGVMVAVIGVRFWTLTRNDRRFSFDSSGPYRVKRVVDGDTLLLDDGTRVRLIGVDTPETKHPDQPVDPLGLQAAEFTRRHVAGRFVTLKFDWERRDKYRRVLAYVYRRDWCLNEELIRAGFSRAETRFPYSRRMKKRFRAAEAEAREHKRGLWSRRRETGIPARRPFENSLSPSRRRSF